MKRSAPSVIGTLGLPAADNMTAIITSRLAPAATAINNRALFALTMLLAAGLLFQTAPLRASVMADFDGGADTPLTLEQFSGPPGPSIEAAGGNPGGFLQLTDTVNNQNNFASFDLTDPGTFSTSSFSFDFRIALGQFPSADGFSFSYADTSTYGTSGGLGSPPFAPEDPAAPDVLGFGFDTWSNQGAFDDPNQPTGSDYSEVSVFWDGGLIARIDDTRLLTPALTLDDGEWHAVTGLVNFTLGTVNLSVDGNALFSDLAVPGLAPFESRILLAGRTGGENQQTGIDNVRVDFGEAAEMPAPITLWLLLGVGCVLLLVRSRRPQHQPS